MEDYDKFVQHRISQLKSEEKQHQKPSNASSLICFYGRPILPPLLSGEQREEMQRHRDAPQKAAGHRMLKDDPRMAYVQSLLQSVQLRKTQTLEELLRESEMITNSSYSHNTNNRAELQSNFFGTKDSVSLLPPSIESVQASVSSPPMTSTTYSTFFTSNVTPHQSYDLLTKIAVNRAHNHSSLNGVSQQSVFSGYTSYENVENAISVSGKFDLGSGNHDIGSSESICNMKGIFLDNTSNTIAKMPDIISYPPIDGEELERSGLESAFSNNSTGVKDNCYTSFQGDSVICNHLPEEKSEINCIDGTEGGENSPFGTVIDLDKDRSSDELRATCFSENSLEISPTLTSHHCSKTEPHIQLQLKETKPAVRHIDEAEPSEEPSRLSLQALLKKSQEYRRCQRMLRNQAKNTKIQERTLEQARAKAEEQSHSDKENDEFPKKGNMTSEEMKTKDRRGSFIPTVEMSTKKLWENERVIEGGNVGKNLNIKSESIYSTGDEKPKEMPSVLEEAVFRNNKLNSSPVVIAEPKDIGILFQQPMSTNTSLHQETFYSTRSPTALYKGTRKYTIPLPNLCRSPIHYKSRSSCKDGEAADGREKVVGKSGLNEDFNVGTERSLEHSIHTANASPVSVMVKGNIMLGMDLAMRSQPIDQLESSLKVLISDLESTVKGNLENISQTESNTQSECSFKRIEHCVQINNDHLLQQSDGDYLDAKLGDDGDSSYAEYKQWPRIESFNNCYKTHKDRGPGLCDPDYIPLIVQGKGPESVNIRELRLVKAVTLERHKEKWTGKEGKTQTYSCRNQQPAAKCILSTAQWMRIPNVFRNVPPESTIPRVSVLSDTSNHPADRRTDTVGKGHDSNHTSSLNQSYDVDTPSELWLLDQSGSELGSKGDLAQEKHLTPESGEGQGSVSKVKRRLLMYGAEETWERSPDTIRGASSLVLPGIPKAPVHVHGTYGSQDDKQEQLKQVHAAQIRALQDEHRRQQEELLQALATCHSLLQSMSFPVSMSASRLGNPLTFSTLSQHSIPLSECYRPLLLAAIKGFLTRRLLRTERVEQLVRTVRDTQQFLQAFQQQSPTSESDLLLQERVTMQLRAARYEVHDIFFSLSARERMQLINWDRELAIERQLRRQNGYTGQPRGRSSLSTATQKSLERKRGIMIQKKAAEKHRGFVMRTGPKTGFSAEQPLKTKQGQFRANPQRVSKSTYSTRPR